MVSTKVLTRSGTGFGWCINQYDGCVHGCKYCYGMSNRRKKYEDWIKAKTREDVAAKLEEDIKIIKENKVVVKDIFVGSICDSYQPLESKTGLTRTIIKLLIASKLPFTMLTKSDLVLRDIDLFKDYKLCRVGVTITSVNEDFRRYMEPGAVSIERRISALHALKEHNVSTYLSCEPILPVEEVNPIAVVEETKDFVDLFEFGKWSRYRYKHLPEYYYSQYSDNYYVRSFSEIIDYCETNKINYCLASHSKDFVEANGLKFTPYPTVIS